MGRPTKLTPETQEIICKHIARGLPYASACRLAGICESTFALWRQKGNEDEDGESIYSEFSEAVARANDEFRQWVHDKHIEAADSGDYRAAGDLARARFPEEYSERRIVKHEGSVEVGLRKLDDAELDARIKAMTEQDDAD